MSFEDNAQKTELKEWERINASRPDPVKYRPGDIGYGPDLCVRCDNDMPKERREHGFKICRPCKSLEEATGPRYNR